MIFKRSLLREMAGTALTSFAVLLGIVLAQRVAFYLGFAARGSLASEAIGPLLGFSLIRFMPMLLTLTLFLAVLLTLTRSYRDSEMVVWFSSGVGLSAWVRPVLAFALPVVGVIAFLSLFVTPWAIQKAVDYREQIESRDELAALTPGVFKESSSAERVFFVESFNQFGNTVRNVFVQSTQHQKLGVMVAQEGSRHVESNGDTFLILQNGRRYEGTPNTPEFSVTHFERYAVRVEPVEVKPDPPTPKSISSLELLQRKGKASKAELHWRLAMPISAFVLVLLAIPLSFVDPRAGRSANLIMAILIYVIYSNTLSIAQAWTAQGKIDPLIGLWPVHGMVLLLTGYLFYRRLLLLPLLPRILGGR